MKKTFLLICLLISLNIISDNVAFAVEPREMLKDSQLEERARKISKELRCVVCQNESIDDSSAIIAKDMRRLVRKRILDGNTDEEIISYMVNRYGEFVLLRPKLNIQNSILWFSPIILLILGIIILYYQRKKSSPISYEKLSESEQKQFNQINQSFMNKEIK